MGREADAANPQANLLAPVDAETWLLNRLQQHGVDVYAGGPFTCLRDRLAHAIVTYQHGPVIAGRGPNGRPESYEALFARMYSVTLKDALKAAKAVAA